MDTFKFSELDKLFFDTNDYTLSSDIVGSGAFGDVYIATDADKKKYAVKVFKADNFTGEDQKNLLRESLILQKLDHPGIIRYVGINFQSFEDEVRLSPSMITEYIPNGSLGNIFNENYPAGFVYDSTNKLKILLGISHSMKYLHSHGILHRDLKPDNVLIDENFNPRICDFGLSRIFPESLSKSQELKVTNPFGSTLYMPPELLVDSEKNNFSSSNDVYSFSMIAYEVVSGIHPFSKLRMMELIKNVCKGRRPEMPDEVDDEMADLISRCWAQNPDDRPSFEEIYNELSHNISMIGRDVNKKEVQKYIRMLEDSDKMEKNLKKKSRIEIEEKEEILEEENDELKKEIKKLKEIVKRCRRDSERENDEEAQLSDDVIGAIFKLLGQKEERNSMEAISLLKWSSENGNNQSSFLAGFVYENGIRVDRDFDKAKHYYELAANQGNYLGWYRLGCCYELGLGTAKNYENAFNYFKMAADKGNSHALCDLGCCYHFGFGVKSDSEKAIEYFQRAADLNNSKALFTLGICYLKGLGVDKNYKKAVDLFKRAAQLGRADAFCSLAECYLNGNGLPKNNAKAIENYKKSMELGCKKAKIALDQITNTKKS